LNRFIQFKIDMKRGKRARRGGPGIGGTPEQIAAKMLPKLERMKQDGLNAEIAAAHRVQRTWEERNAKHRPKR